jgi:flagellar hook assembly protein FlgD
LAEDAQVEVEVLNQLGQRVKTITTKKQLTSGVHRLIWNGRNAGNGEVSPGIYHLRIEIDNIITHRKIVLSK